MPQQAFLAWSVRQINRSRGVTVTWERVALHALLAALTPCLRIIGYSARQTLRQNIEQQAELDAFNDYAFGSDSDAEC